MINLFNAVLNPDRTLKNCISVDEITARLPECPIDILPEDIFVENAPPIPEGMHTPQLSIDGTSWVEANISGALEIQKEKDRIQLKTERDNALKNITHDFGDGRIVQVRPEDIANFQIAINIGLTQEWVMQNNTIASLTAAELQEAFDSGIAQGKQIWQTYIDSIKIL